MLHQKCQWILVPFDSIRQTAGKVAGAFGTIALATTGVPEAANAAKATKEVVQTSLDIKKIGGIAAGAFGIGLIATKLTGEKENETTKKIDRVFHGAMKSKDLVNSVASSLKKHGFTTSNTLIATSFCVDELSRVNEKDFAEVFGPTFNLGGLSGIPVRHVIQILSVSFVKDLNTNFTRSFISFPPVCGADRLWGDGISHS